jgi:membrane-bound lytic murein transglycosylase B
VSVPASLSRTSVAPRTASPRCPRVMQRQSAWKTVAEWRALGLAATRRPWPTDETLAMLIEPDGPAQPAYLVTGNYRVILDYNCSNFYALSVGLLADAIEQ